MLQQSINTRKQKSKIQVSNLLFSVVAVLSFLPASEPFHFFLIRVFGFGFARPLFLCERFSTTPASSSFFWTSAFSTVLTSRLCFAAVFLNAASSFK